MVDDIYVSFSDVERFLRCRTAWDFSSSNRQGIRHKITPKLYLSLGSAVHKALEANLRGEDPLEACRAYLDAERTAKSEAYTEEYGSKPWASELAEFDEAADLSNTLVHQYFEHYDIDNPLADQGLEHIGIEVPFKIDISDWFPDLGVKVYFVGTLDGIAVDEHDGIFVVENKTFSKKLSPEDIQWHWQSQGYAVALQWLTGMPVTGGLYNGIAKKIIKEPKVLAKNGLLSTDKRQSTTYQRYVQAIAANGESVDDDRFSDILQHLRSLDEQGDTRFFYREKFFFSGEQLDSWQTDFMSIVHEMVGAPLIYRTIPFSGCSDCWFSDLCHTKHSGGDVDFLMEKRYTQGSYGTIEAVKGVEPTVISSVADLKEYLRNEQ